MKPRQLLTLLQRLRALYTSAELSRALGRPAASLRRESNTGRLSPATIAALLAHQQRQQRAWQRRAEGTARTDGPTVSREPAPSSGETPRERELRLALEAERKLRLDAEAKAAELTTQLAATSGELERTRSSNQALQGELQSTRAAINELRLDLAGRPTTTGAPTTTGEPDDFEEVEPTQLTRRQSLTLFNLIREADSTLQKKVVQQSIHIETDGSLVGLTTSGEELRCYIVIPKEVAESGAPFAELLAEASVYWTDDLVLQSFERAALGGFDDQSNYGKFFQQNIVLFKFQIPEAEAA